MTENKISEAMNHGTDTPPIEIKVSEKTCMRIATLILNHDVAREFLDQHLEDVHGTNLREVEGVKVEIMIRK